MGALVHSYWLDPISAPAVSGLMWHVLPFGLYVFYTFYSATR